MARSCKVIKCISHLTPGFNLTLIVNIAATHIRLKIPGTWGRLLPLFADFFAIFIYSCFYSFCKSIMSLSNFQNCLFIKKLFPREREKENFPEDLNSETDRMSP